MAQCRGIIDDQQLFKDVCAAGLLYSVCFRDGIKALGWTPITRTDANRKNLQDARDWLLAHLGTSNITETISNETQSQNLISIYNDMNNINKTDITYNRIAEEYNKVTNTANGYEYTTVQTLTDTFAKDVIADNTPVHSYNVTNTKNSVNTVVPKTEDVRNSSMIKEKNISETTAPDAVEDAVQTSYVTPLLKII